jgi:hypothetical protein
MNEPDDALEAELAALRPRDVSPALQQRVAERLGDAPSARSRWIWGVALAGGLAAACLAAVLLLGRGGGPSAPTGQTIVEALPKLHGPADDSLPSLQAYQRALARSPEELDALLDRHAASAAPLDPQEGRVHAFPRSDVEIDALIGEP